MTIREVLEADWHVAEINVTVRDRETTKYIMDTDFDYILDCPLPDDDQEILVCYKSGCVATDTFLNDCSECYLDSGDDFIDDVIAWQPLPAPYQLKGE